MGYLLHHTIVVSGCSLSDVAGAHRVACKEFSAEGLPGLVSGLVPHVMNGGAAFFISPDGSKEGWEHSHKGDRARSKFIAALRGMPVDWALVQIGGDDGVFAVLDSPSALSTEKEPVK